MTETLILSTYIYPRFSTAARPSSTAAARAAAGGRRRRRPGRADRCAIEFAQRGLPVLLLDDDDTVSVGSRGHVLRQAHARDPRPPGMRPAGRRQGRDLERRRTFFDTEEVFSFDLQPEPGHAPGMVNLQQYYLEEYQGRAARGLPGWTALQAQG